MSTPQLLSRDADWSSYPVGMVHILHLGPAILGLPSQELLLFTSFDGSIMPIMAIGAMCTPITKTCFILVAREMFRSTVVASLVKPWDGDAFGLLAVMVWTTGYSVH